MHISRIQIEGGFLNGLDLRLPPGLITIIGARGTGKTSLIELIRFALNVDNNTSEARQISIDHARAVLSDGEISIAIDDSFNTSYVSRTYLEKESRTVDPVRSPIIFSQKEIEAVGLTDSGRLRLVDSFSDDVEIYTEREEQLAQEIKAVSNKIYAELTRIDSLTENINELDALRAYADALQLRSATSVSDSKDIKYKQDRLVQITDNIIDLSLTDDYLSRTINNLEDWIKSLRDTSIEKSVFEEWDERIGPDPTVYIKNKYKLALNQIAGTMELFSAMHEDARVIQKGVQEQQIDLEIKARSLRADFEKMVEGAGRISKQLSSTRSRIAQLEATERNLRQVEKLKNDLFREREELLDQLEKVRAYKFSQRLYIIEKLNESLRPRIDIGIERFGQYRPYIEALAEALKGSGIKYRDLSEIIAESISPRELVKYVEDNNYEFLSSLTGISKERAARVVIALRSSDLGGILVAPIEDNIKMMLLDGTEYKSLLELSSGQRCTVILPIVLQHHDRILIIDQPEDHIDNAFISDTLIKSLKSRPRNTQIIMSTHNANIPVLGEADLVVQLISDGRNATVEVECKIDHPKSVKAITNVMEGGMKAFKDRARFYSSCR